MRFPRISVGCLYDVARLVVGCLLGFLLGVRMMSIEVGCV